jgi:RecA/RadA recombinase
MAIDRLPVKNTIIVTAILVAAAFLAGYLPSYAKGKRLESELQVALQQNRMAQLRDLAALSYLQATQKNYGLAAATTAQYFALLPVVAAEVPNPAGKKSLQDLASSRDRITAELAKGDPAVLSSLENLLLTTRQATDTR